MKISRKALYAIRAMIYVASIKDSHLCTISEIAEKEDIPREYIAKILNELTRSGFLVSYRGVQGGYKLKKNRSDITFLEIVEAVQGHFGDIKGEAFNKHTKIYHGAAREFWSDLLNLIKYKLGDMKLDRIDYARYYG
jgi:Rrf2 family protein